MCDYLSKNQHTVYYKSFEVEKLHSFKNELKFAGNIHGCMAVLYGQTPLYRVVITISLEEFHSY